MFSEAEICILQFSLCAPIFFLEVQIIPFLLLLQLLFCLGTALFSSKQAVIFTSLLPPTPTSQLVFCRYKGKTLGELRYYSQNTPAHPQSNNNNQRQGVLVLSLLLEHSGLTTLYGVALLIIHVLMEIITFITKPCIDRAECPSFQ